MLADDPGQLAKCDWFPGEVQHVVIGMVSATARARLARMALDVICTNMIGEFIQRITRRCTLREMRYFTYSSA